MPVVLIAYGPNDIEIPCRIFESFGEAEKICDKIFMPHIEPEDKTVFADNDMTCISYRCYLEEEGDPEGNTKEIISNTLFTSYYYGCGSPYKFVIKHVGYNRKFVKFDLD